MRIRCVSFVFTYLSVLCNSVCRMILRFRLVSQSSTIFLLFMPDFTSVRIGIVRVGINNIDIK